MYKTLERLGAVKDSSWPAKYVLPSDAATTGGVAYIPIVEPAAFAEGEAAQRWQKGREMFGSGVKNLNLEKLSLPEARSKFREATSTMLAMVVFLDQIEDGPDWRERAGL